jgi:AbrB family looped-hinge helix DNA binding protein
MFEPFGIEFGNDAMSVVKLLRGGRITLPAEIRRALELGEGDYLEAEMVAGALVLKPKTSVDREQAWERLMRIIERPKWRGPGAEPSEDELMAEVVEDIQAMRREHESRSR